MDLEKFEKECEEVCKRNEILLNNYKVYLQKKGLSDKSIKEHIGDVRFFINSFLLRESVIEAKDGWNKIGDYLGDFFIYKCMWSTPNTLKSSVSSLKGFYKYLRNEKIIEEKQYDFMYKEIQEHKDEWIELCKEYNDGNFSYL